MVSRTRDRHLAFLTTLCFLFSINMTGTWSCEAGKICGTWLARYCCEHPDDHPYPPAGQTVMDHEDHGCRFSPVSPNPRAVRCAPVLPVADSPLTMPAAADEMLLLVAESVALIPDSRGPPEIRIRTFGSPGLRAPPLS